MRYDEQAGDIKIMYSGPSASGMNTRDKVFDKGCLNRVNTKVQSCAMLMSKKVRGVWERQITAKSKGMGNEINPRFLKNIARGKKRSLQSALCHVKRKAGIVDWRMPTDVSHESIKPSSGEGRRNDQTEK